MEIAKKEIRDLIIVAFIAAFVLSFNEWGINTFSFLTGIKNLSISFAFCMIVYIVYIFAQKLSAKYYEYEVNFEMLQIEKRIRSIRRKTTFPIGPIITVLITLISAGKFFFIVLNSFTLVPNEELRTGRKWTGVKEFEEAQVALAGPMSLIVLLILFKILVYFNPIFEKGMFIASTIMIFNMLPLPKVDGSKIFFGSRTLYVTGLAFGISFVLLLFYLSIIQTIMLALIIALAMGIAYLYSVAK